MKKMSVILWKLFVFTMLTIVTQIGGIAFLISQFLKNRIRWNSKLKASALFILVYSILTFLLVPLIAPFFGREKVYNSSKIKPANYLTLILNRNYVKPQLNEVLRNIETDLKDTDITLNYLDANFPFINKFPLFPHLSHYDGKKIDVGLIYQTKDGKCTDKQKSRSGYGVFEEPKTNEFNQINKCKSNGYFQYDFPKYLTFGTINRELQFSEKGTKTLLLSILKQELVGKIFIEPHLKERMNLYDSKIRYQGCRSMRHDDHIHIQLK